MLLKALKCLGADDVLYTAGVLGCYLGADRHADQPGREQRVPVIYLVGYLPALVQKGYEAFFVNFDISVGPEVFHGHADARLGKTQLVCDVYGADVSLAVVYDEYSFKVVFGWIPGSSRVCHLTWRLIFLHILSHYILPSQVQNAVDNLTEAGYSRFYTELEAGYVQTFKNRRPRAARGIQLSARHGRRRRCS